MIISLVGTTLIFLSTPSARRATKYPPPLTMHQYISIHALREEGDPGKSTKSHTTKHFYPRPPRGGRPFPWIAPARRRCISIHALREEGDLS